MFIRLLVAAGLAATLYAPLVFGQSRADRDRWDADCRNMGGHMNWETGVCENANGGSGSYGEDDGTHCRAACRAIIRENKAWKQTKLGNDALKKFKFDSARKHYRRALEYVPGMSVAQSNLSLVDRNETAVLFNRGLEAFDKGEYRQARSLFLKAQSVSPWEQAIAAELAKLDDWERFKPSRAGMVLGTGAQEGWNVPAKFTEEQREDAYRWLKEQAGIAGRPFPAGVDMSLYDFGIGIANSTTEWNDLVTRVLRDQVKAVPTSQSGLRGYNALRGRAFDLLACHSNGAMTCLLALENNDAKARDVVLYAPQITPDSAAMWQRLIANNRIRSLRIIVNENDPVTPLALLVNSNPTSWLRARALLFDVGEVKSSLSSMIPDAQVDARACSANWPTLTCHRLTAYPQCKPGKSSKKVAGTRGLAGASYTEPPPPQC